jgi:hypothetical protein
MKVRVVVVALGVLGAMVRLERPSRRPRRRSRAIELLDANEQGFAAEVNFAEAQFSVASAYLVAA